MIDPLEQMTYHGLQFGRKILRHFNDLVGQTLILSHISSNGVIVCVKSCTDTRFYQIQEFTRTFDLIPKCRKIFFFQTVEIYIATMKTGNREYIIYRLTPQAGNA